VVRRCVRERIIEVTAIPLRGVQKSVEIFLDIDRLEEQALVTILLGVFLRTGALPLMPHILNPVPKKSAVEQPLPFRGKIKRVFIDLVGSPHAVTFESLLCGI
jgi:hypothetical protein